MYAVRSSRSSEAVDFLLCAGWCLLEEDLEEALGSQRSFSLVDLTAVLRRLKSKKANLTVAKPFGL